MWWRCSRLFCSVRMGVGVGSVGNRGGDVVSGGGNANVTDGGADGGGTINNND